MRHYLHLVLVLSLFFADVAPLYAAPRAGMVTPSASQMGVEKITLSEKYAMGSFVQGVPAISSDLQVLSTKDVATYRKLFALQKELKRTEVAQLVPQLEDKVLMGHLIGVRIMHPNTTTPYSDLQQWLAYYNDHYQAITVYQLANRRKPKDSKASHNTPTFWSPTVARYVDPDAQRALNDPKTKARNALKSELYRIRRAKDYDKAVGVISKAQTRETLGSDVWADEALKIARALEVNGKFALMEKVATQVVQKAEYKRSEAMWMQGFAQYRQKKYASSAKTLRALVDEIPTNSVYYARAAWWAARSYEGLNQESVANVFYDLAAKDPFSFYGLMAAERRGIQFQENWRYPQISREDRQKILQHKGLRRVIALAQIGEHAMAQSEFRAIYKDLPQQIDESLLALCLQLHLPNPSMTLSRNLMEGGKVYYTGYYPVITAWQPEDGFKTDPALLHAIMRQESAFNPAISSRVGAAGLMQIMPATARYIRHLQRKPNLSKADLYDPHINLMLGQFYMGYLHEKFAGNLLHMVAAYNGGPASVERWIQEFPEMKDDPVLFVESIPFSETRTYVKKVMANLWIYQKRFRTPSVTLTAMAHNQWPYEVAMLNRKTP